jgi:hypothetical protein
VERHRLQLPRRSLRHGVRGPGRGCRAQRRRRARAGVQRRHGRRRADRELQLDDADGGAAEGAGRAARLEARRRAPRSVLHRRVHLEPDASSRCARSQAIATPAPRSAPVRAPTPCCRRSSIASPSRASPSSIRPRWSGCSGGRFASARGFRRASTGR